MATVSAEQAATTAAQALALGKLGRSRAVFGFSLLAVASLVTCARNRGVDILSLTVITGSLNASPFEGRVSATFNTRRGGSATCEFSKLPTRFTPATLSSHT